MKHYPCDADYPPSGRCQGNVTHFYILGPRLSLEWMKLDISNLVCRLNIKSTGITHVKVLQHGGGHLRSRDLFKFWKISANISETVHDRHIVIMEG